MSDSHLAIDGTRNGKVGHKRGRGIPNSSRRKTGNPGQDRKTAGPKKPIVKSVETNDGTNAATRRDSDALGAQRMIDEKDHQSLLKAGKVWLRHQEEQRRRWCDWTEILGPALMKAQTQAMSVAVSNRPEGKRYARAMSSLLKAYGLDTIDSADRTNALHIMHYTQEIATWRMKQVQPDKLNNPTTVWRGFVRSDEGRTILRESGIMRKQRKRIMSKTRSANELEATKAELAERTIECEQLRDQLEEVRGAAPVKVEPADLVAALSTLLKSKTNLGIEHMRASEAAPHEVRDLAEELWRMADKMTEVPLP